MKVRMLLIAALAIAMLFISAPLQSQDKKKGEDPFKKAIEKYGTPGPEHKHLRYFIGNWKVKAKMYAAPDAPPMEFDGTSKVRYLLGKRYIQEIYNGNFASMKFTGIGLTGFDRMKKKFVGSWMDSFSTGFMTMEGTFDPKTKTFTFDSTYKDPMNGVKYQSKSIVRIINKNEQEHIMERRPAAKKDAKYSKHMELRYTRAGKKK